MSALRVFRLMLVMAIVSLVVAAVSCAESDDDASPSGTATAPAASGEQTTGAAPPTQAESAAPVTDPPATDAPADAGGPGSPAGRLPIDSQTRLGVVTGDVGSREPVFDGAGPVALDYARDVQPSDDADAANRSGWNCRVHAEYEGSPAVDFYIPVGTPILATHDGTATLYAVSWMNDFERYDVSREPYLGNPDRSRAALVPFPGRSSGLGVYVRLENDQFITGYGHLEIDLSVDAIPATAFVGDFSPQTDYGTEFSEVPEPRIPIPVAEWEVTAGEVIGMSGDSGYSEGPHLHYTVQRTDGPGPVCPTTEAGFEDGGWLFKSE